MSAGRRSRLVIGAVVVAALLAAGAVAYRTGRGGQRASAFSPEVRHTGAAPTGYVVTFRYRDPSAKSVLIHGEWYFSDPKVTTSTSSQGLLPAQWKRGDVATGWPAPSTPDGWPVTEMMKDPRTGVWSYSIPLPSGYYNYGFYVGCSIDEALSSPDQTVGCADPEVADPSNPPWNDQHGVSTGSSDGRSEVYVPADPAFDNVNDSWEGPTSPKGELTDVSYTSLADVSAPGRLAMNYLAIYTPHGYDQHRSTPYPTLYLSPGSGLNEVDWSTQGDAANILDNLINSHQIKPAVVVMTSTSCSGCDPTTASPTDYDQDVLLDVIPYVQAHYDVSKDPSRRAFAGFSAGGWAAGSLLVDDAGMFGSFGLFSPCPAAANTPTAAQAAAIKGVRVMVGGGNEDPECHPYADDDVAAIQSAGVQPDTEFFYGGHDWDVWRILLKDFLTNVAFKPAGPSAA
jgi:enterochelin esterase-like enzyme